MLDPAGTLFLYYTNQTATCRLLILPLHNFFFPGTSNINDSDDAGQSTPSRSRNSSEMDDEEEDTSASDVNTYATADNRKSSTAVGKRRKTTASAPTRVQPGRGRGRPPKHPQSPADVASQQTVKTPNKDKQKKLTKKQLETQYMREYMSCDEVGPVGSQRLVLAATSVFAKSSLVAPSSASALSNRQGQTVPLAFTSSIAPKL